jgi:hydrogenase nickel incorporation protein HypA/HybF
MHEISLVRSLIKQVQNVVANEGGGKVSAIHVSIGPLSGVEPMLVQCAFEQLAPESQLNHAILTIDGTQLEAICERCNASFIVESFCFQCPTCQSRSVRITKGDEFRLLSVSVEDDQPTCLKEEAAK